MGDSLEQLDERHEYTNCPICSAAGKKVLYHLVAPYRVVTCTACGFHYMDPRLREEHMMELYGDDSYFGSETVGYVDYTMQEQALRLTFRRFIKVMAAAGLTGGSLLEIGVGHGFFLDEARAYFDYRVGTEMSRSAAVNAAKFADCVIHGGCSDLPADSRFDCIVMSQVLEHVYHPKAFIERIMVNLNRGGRLLIITPDIGNFWRVLMRASWPSFKVPEHVLFFNRYSLVGLLKQCGFREARSLPYPHAFPLKLVAAKLNLTPPKRLEKLNIWLPHTSLAICASNHV
ncbi:MAG: hypothetical protein A2X79_01030 [Desulfuromonadaceae bacterium GWB2_53_15]|nr:MAG: hypothetical protein A2X79_01030 [Desulfuromonadaceae bacterium GWB2_53_15]